jgi:hypothetical protein
MNNFLGTFFLLLISFNGFATDCGLKPKGMEFGPNCELLRGKLRQAKTLVHTEPVKKESELPASVQPQKKWQALQLGAYAGKPGYYVKIGTEFQLKIDALLMNEDVLAKVEKATADLKLGGVTICQGVGLQQSIGYTLFDIRNCDDRTH